MLRLFQVLVAGCQAQTVLLLLCQARTVSMAVWFSFHNQPGQQPNLGLSCYLKGLDLENLILTSQTLDLEAETLRDICERRNLIESDMIFVQFYVYSI